MERRRARQPNRWSAELLAGLRRNARALVVGGALLVGLWLTPDLTPALDYQRPLDLAHGRIESRIATPGDPTDPDVRVAIISGPGAGTTVDAYLQGPAGQQDVPDYRIGDEVVVSLSLGPDSTYVAVSDRYRLPLFVLIVALFGLGTIAVGGWRGVRSLLALALTLGVVARIVVPLLLAGWQPVPLAVLAGSAVTLVTILLTEGLRPSSLAAVGGTFAALLLTAVLAATVNDAAGFSRFQGQEAAVFLESLGLADIDLAGIMLAAVIFGALGVLDDVTVTQAATVHELAVADPGASAAKLAGRAMNVGRSHIAATVNTLVLAYLGASLPLLLLFAAGRTDPALTASGEAVAVEIVRALVGSIGIVAAVPLTTAIAVLAVKARGAGTVPGPSRAAP